MFSISVWSPLLPISHKHEHTHTDTQIACDCWDTVSGFKRENTENIGKTKQQGEGRIQRKPRPIGNTAGKNHQEAEQRLWEDEKKRWKGDTPGKRDGQNKWERRDSCCVLRWLSGGPQRQTWFSNPVVSAGCHPDPLCNPVNMHQISSRKHTHRVQVEATHGAVATHAHYRHHASCRDTISERTQTRMNVLSKHQDSRNVFLSL